MYAIDVHLADVVVRVYYPEVILQVFGCEVDVSADIDVGGAPGSRYVVVLAFRAKGSVSGLPSSLYLVLLIPVVARVCVFHLAYPASLVAHRCDGFKCGTPLCSHETVCSAVHAQESVHGLDLVVPMACGTSRQFVVWRPERDVGVVYY